MIRKLILRLLITGVSVSAMIYILPGVSYIGGLTELAKIIGVFFLANLFLKPVLKILTLPIEIATLGLFSVIINAFIIWLVAGWIAEFKLTSFWFSGLHGTSFVIAPFEIPTIITAVIGALIIGFTSTFLYWITK